MAAETRWKFDEDFKQEAVRIVRETEKPIAQVARELPMASVRSGAELRRLFHRA